MTLSPGQDPPVDDIVAQARSMTTAQLEDKLYALKDEMRKTITDLLVHDDEIFQNLISARNKIDFHEKEGTLESNRDLLFVKKDIHNAEKNNYRMGRDLYMQSSFMRLDALYDELQLRAYRPLMALPPATVAPSTALPHAREWRENGTPVALEPQVAWSRPTASSFMASLSGKIDVSNSRPTSSSFMAPSNGKVDGSNSRVSVHATGSLPGAGARVGTSGSTPKTFGQGSGSQPIIIELSDSEPEPEPRPFKRAPSVASSVAGSQARSAKKIRATPTKLKVLGRLKKKLSRLRAVTLPKPSTKRTESFQQVWSELQQKAAEHTTQTTLMEPSFKSLTMETFGKHGQTMPTFRPLETTKNVVFSTKDEVLNWKWLRPVQDQTEVLFFSDWKTVPENWKPSDIITHYNVARKRKEAIFFEMMAIITLLLNRDEAKRLKLVFFAEENSLQSLLNPLMHSRQHLVRMAWCTRDFEVHRVCGLDPKKRR
ncbi:hypothetical protein BG006_004044 [Podila minutissima]|uniref:Uncharacterized protein n=1 Tax=Podila minutissima TaxID=64525 RepID=A0A9P5VN20_9FUNG|nr:hypothetical protein BG006_004044 [Podila minutissima]